MPLLVRQKWIHIFLAIVFVSFLIKAYGSRAHYQNLYQEFDPLRSNLHKENYISKSTDVWVDNSDSDLQGVVSDFTRSKRSVDTKSTTEVVTTSKKDDDELYSNVPLSKKQEIFEEIDEPILPHSPKNMYKDDDDALTNGNDRKANAVEIDDYKHVVDVDDAVSDELKSILGDDTGLERSLNGESKDYTLKMPTAIPVLPTTSKSTVAFRPSSSENIGNDVELAIDENTEHNKDIPKEAAQMSVVQENDQQSQAIDSHFEENQDVFGGIERNEQQPTEKERELEKEKQAFDFQQLLNGNTNVVVKDNDKKQEDDNNQKVLHSISSNKGQDVTNISDDLNQKDDKEQYFPLAPSQGVTETINDYHQGTWTVSLHTNRAKDNTSAGDVRGKVATASLKTSDDTIKIKENSLMKNVNDNSGDDVEDKTNHKNDDGIYIPMARKIKKLEDTTYIKNAHNISFNNETNNIHDDLKGMIDSNDDGESGNKSTAHRTASSFIKEHPIAFNILMEYFKNETHLREQLHNKLKGLKAEEQATKKSKGLHSHLPMRQFITKLLKLAKKYEKKIIEKARKSNKNIKDIVATLKMHSKKKVKQTLHYVRGSRKNAVLPKNNKVITSLNKTKATPASAPQKDMNQAAHIAPQTTMSPLEVDNALKAMENTINKMLTQNEKPIQQIPQQITSNYLNPTFTQQITPNVLTQSTNPQMTSNYEVNQPNTQQMMLNVQPTTEQMAQNGLNQPNSQQMMLNALNQPTTQQMAQSGLNQPNSQQMAQNRLNQPTAQQMMANALNQPTTQQVTLNGVSQPATQMALNGFNQPTIQQMAMNTANQPATQQMTLNDLNQALNQNFTQMNNVPYRNRLKTLSSSLSQDFFRFWMYHFKSFKEMSINPEQLRSGIASLGSTRRLGRVVRKALQGKAINLLIVGGSISAGGGLERDRHDVHGIYFKALEEWWKNVVEPITGAHLQMDVVAIGGTDSEYFSYCIKNYIHQQPDLVLWELAANDYRRYLGRDMDPAKPLEQLTRVLLDLPTHPAIIFVNFFRGDYYKTTLGQNCPDSEDEGGRLIAEYYKIASLSWRNVICSQMKQEPLFASLAFKREYSPLSLKTLFSSDGYHPSLLGHAQCASLLISYIRSVFEEVVSQEVAKFTTGTPYNDMNTNEHFVLPRPIYDDPPHPNPLCWTLLTPNYNIKIANSLPNLKVVQAKGFVLTNVTHWPVRTDRLRCLKALYPGATLVVSFFAPVHMNDVTKPIREMVLISHNSFTGSANVWLDNHSASPMFIKEPAGQRRTQINIVSRDLSPGGHVMTISAVQAGFCVSGLAIL